MVNYGPCIFLISLGLNPKEKVLCLDSFLSHRILANILNITLKNKLELKYDIQPSLSAFREILISFFNRINSNNKDLPGNTAPHWEQLINCFFHHIFALPDQHQQILIVPFLLRIDNHIFLELGYEATFPSEILSIITKTQYSQIFEYIRREESPENIHFSKYLIKDEILLIPEIPIELRKQIFRFYNLLIDTFQELHFTEKEEKQEATYVLEYLVTLRDFLGPN